MVYIKAWTEGLTLILSFFVLIISIYLVKAFFKIFFHKFLVFNIKFGIILGLIVVKTLKKKI